MRRWNRWGQSSPRSGPTWQPADLLPPGYGAGLADLPRGGPAAPAAVIREMVARELGRMSVVTFTAFEEEPYEIGLLYQVHRAVLTDGRPVVVKLAPPGLDEDIARDLDTLPLLRAVLAGVPEAAVPLDGLIAEFRQSVRQQDDCLRDAKVLEAVAQDLGEYEGLGVPRVHRRLCTGRMVTLERLPGKGLAAGHGGPGLASLLCTAWLQQALFGRFFPAEADPNSVAVLPDGRLAFGGPFASVPPSARKDFWEYLLAVSADHPDAACGTWSAC